MTEYLPEIARALACLLSVCVVAHLCRITFDAVNAFLDDIRSLEEYRSWSTFIPHALLLALLILVHTLTICAAFYGVTIFVRTYLLG